MQGTWPPLESLPLSLSRESQDGETHSSHLPGPGLLPLNQETVAKVSCPMSLRKRWPC